MNILDTNLVQVDAASFTKKRKRMLPYKSCVRCHERKVKCDIAGLADPTGPCKNCVSSGQPCRRHLDGRTRTSHQAATQGQENSTHAVQSCDSRAQASATVDERAPRSDSLTDTNDSLIPAHQPVSEVANATSASVPLLQVNQPAIEETISQLDLSPASDDAESAAQQQPSQVTHAPMDRFQAYVQDNLGSFAPSFRSHNERSVFHSRSSDGRSGASALEPQWDVDMSSRSTLDLELQMANLDSADMDYLKAKGVFQLPPRNIQEDLVDAYFDEVHPTAPVINRTEFLATFHSHQMPSRLLLFAIFASGSRACRNPALLDHNGTNHTVAQRFYKATKALLDTGYEQSKLARIQALLLITWWWDKKDDGGRNMRSCVVDAINTAQSIGMHRWDHYPHSNPVLLGQWKRIWWTCFNRDAGVAVAHGLPPLLSLSNFDVLPLTPEDFVESHTTSPGLQQYPYTRIEISFMIELPKVMEAQHHVQRDHFARKRLRQAMTGSIAQREALVESGEVLASSTQDNLPDDFRDYGFLLCKRWAEKAPTTISYDVDDIQGHQFWPAFLHILHFTSIMIRFREQSVTRPTNARMAVERQYCQARGIAAATMVSKVMRNTRAHGHLLKYTGQLTNSIFNCLIFFLIEGQSPDNEVRQDAQRKYSLCLNMLYDFSQLWISASLVHRLFESLQVRMQFPNNRPPSPAALRQQAAALPVARVSSEITNADMKRLLATDITYDQDTVDTASLVHSSGSAEMSSLPESFEYETWPSIDPSLGQGLPDTMEVDAWLEFFDHEYGYQEWGILPPKEGRL